MDDIAIIGLSGRYSKSKNPKELWQNLLGDNDLNYRGDSSKGNYVDVYSKVDNIDMFDNELFGFTPYEAKITDPQQRVLLECAFEALQNAGYADISKKSCTGVFTSSSMSTYFINNILSDPNYYDGDVDYSIIIGNDKDFSSTRLAYKFNYEGPAYTIQCACSSSLVALHKACDSLLNFECDMALVGGVSISVPQEKGYNYKEGGILSADGSCSPFDKDACGTIKGNGCSVVVVKRLSEAENDGDRIYAVIKGSAVNNDGSAKIGFTAPSIEGQSAVINECIEYSGLDKSTIDYIEAHGTGTKLGDPIEIKALSNVFNEADCQNIAVGSVKANIGHLDAASGLTSVVKSVFMLNNDIIPANINFKEQNQQFSFRDGLFTFPNSNTERKLNNIGVSSFGLGGTNAHVILSKYNAEEKEKKKYSSYLIPVSVFRNNDRIKMNENLKKYLSDCSSFEDFVFTFSAGTRKFDHRCYCICRDSSELLNMLDKLDTAKKTDAISLPEFSLDDYRYLADNFQSYADEYNSICKDSYSSDDEEYVYYHVAFLSFISLIADDTDCIDLRDNDELIINRIIDGNDIVEILDEIKNACIQPTNNADDTLDTFWRFIGDMWLRTDVDFRELYRGNNWCVTDIPLYPLEKKRFWIEAKEKTEIKVEKEVVNEAISKEECLEIVMDICRDVLEEEDIDPDGDFYDVGGDSLLMLSFLEDINKKFDLTLKLNDFAGINSLREIADMICNIKKTSEESKKYSFVSKIRNGSSKADNLFLMHPAGGTTFCYTLLNKYMSPDVDMNIYTIDLPEDYEKYPSMEALADLYIKAIKSIQKDGSYKLGGYSLGGNLACEMAVQLEANGNTVDEVLLFDSHPPIAYNCYKDEIINYQKVFPVVIANYFNMDEEYLNKIANNPDITIEHVIEEVKNVSAHGNMPIGEDKIKDFYTKWIFTHGILKRHDIKQPIKAKGTMFRGNEKEKGIILSELRIAVVEKEKWNDYFSDNIRIIDVPGDHYTMFGKIENTIELARIFSEKYNSKKEG